MSGTTVMYKAQVAMAKDGGTLCRAGGFFDDAGDAQKAAEAFIEKRGGDISGGRDIMHSGLNLTMLQYLDKGFYVTAEVIINRVVV